MGGLMPIPEHAQGVAPAWMGYVAVDDVAAYADKVKAAGGAIHRGPAEIPNVGTFAVASDPDGAGFLLFRALGEGAPPSDPTGPGHVGWRELNASDGEKAFAFYARLFGWTKTSAMPMGPSNVYQMFATKSGQEGAVFTKDAETPHPFWRFYFNVAAIDARHRTREARRRPDRARPARSSGRPLDRPCARPAGGGLRARRAEALNGRTGRKPCA